MARLTRFAPTPSGFLHAGNAVSFILTAYIARAAGAKILLRIDDLDRARFREEYLNDVFDTLHWLGLDWDFGPKDPADFHAHWSQHRRLPAYHDLLARLQEMDMLYACSCSRSRLRADSVDYRYPGNCRHAGIPLDTHGVAWRIRVPDDAMVEYREGDIRQALDVAALMGDFVVRQKDGLPAYQIASLADDLHFGVDLIVRGKDLLPSTAAQIYLADRLGERTFLQATFHHHGLLLDAEGSKMSKSAGSAALKAWRMAGRSREDLFRMASEWRPPQAQF